MKILFVAPVLFLAITACSTSNHEVKELDTELEQHGAIDDEEIGINDDGEAIIQERVEADDELRRQQWANNVIEEKLATNHFNLKKCRQDVADPRLGGSGTITKIPDIDNMKPADKIKEEFGLDNGELKVVRKEYYLDRLNRERKYEQKLRDMLKTVSQHDEDCTRRLAVLRVKQGLPARAYSAKGYFDANGNWIETRKAELTLDDAFEIRAKENTH